MKKTIIALMALAGVSHADWFNVTGTSGADLFANDGTNYTMFGNGYGNKVAVSADLESAFTTSGSGSHSLNFGTAGEGSTASPSVSISNALYLQQVDTTRATSLTLNFTESGSITTSGAFNVKAISVSITASLSATDTATLNNGGTVVRNLITTDYFETVPNFKDTFTLNIQADGLTYGGLLYSVYSNGSHTYYSFDNVTFNSDGAVNRYATVGSNAKAFELEEGKYYAVLSGTQAKDASVKYLSYVATAPIPEPTTATLSLLALAGLAARRRRK